MTMAKQWLVADIETRIDKALIRQTQYPDLDITDEDAYQRFRAQILEETQGRSDFLPVPYHVPISIAVGHVESGYALSHVYTIGPGHATEQSMVLDFWALLQDGPTLVTFNGRGFDMPVLELAALKYGIPAPTYWNSKYRYRYDDTRHYDVYDVLCNNGAVQLRGGLNVVAALLGYRGKDGMSGSDVQRAWEQGQHADIAAYCRRDVVTTYAVWLKLELIRSRLTLNQYQAALEASEPFLSKIRSGDAPQATLF
jgi:predicted PolB exonuclease-like 3'-5' exonuclease